MLYIIERKLLAFIVLVEWTSIPPPLEKPFAFICKIDQDFMTPQTSDAINKNWAF